MCPSDVLDWKERMGISLGISVLLLLVKCLDISGLYR